MTDLTETKTLTLQDIFDAMDKHYSLTYIDYRDSFDDNLESIQTAIHSQCMDSIYEKTDDWFWDNESDSVQYIIDELKKELSGDYSEDEIEEIFEDNEDAIRDEIYNRDDSTPIDDLIRNTSDPVMFYDLCVDIDDVGYDSEMLKDNIRIIKKTLGILQKNHDYDKRLTMMIQQASYGGRLVVFFRGDIKQMIDTGEYNTIQFVNPEIAVIDTFNGSGDNTDMDGIKFEVPYNPENVFIDKLIKYNYTYEVCGMSSNWCEGTGVHFMHKNKRKAKEQKSSSLHAELAVEEMYNKTFKEGGCTFGDMDIRRHRNTPYRNDFPCGNKCTKCGTFWID